MHSNYIYTKKKMKTSICICTIMVIIFSDKHGIYQLPKDLRLRISEDKQISEETQNFIGLYPALLSSPPPEKVNTSKTLLKNINNFPSSLLFHRKT